MATINLGAIKFNWTGAYNSSTSYAVDDVVSSGGNSYVCIQAHSNQAVGNATAYWNIMSSAGTNGSNGTDLTSTLTTRGDIVYKGASALTRLPKGTAGYYLKQGANDPEWGEVSSGNTVKLGEVIITPSNNTGGVGQVEIQGFFNDSVYAYYKLIYMNVSTVNDSNSSDVYFRMQTGSYTDYTNSIYYSINTSASGTSSGSSDGSGRRYQATDFGFSHNNLEQDSGRGVTGEMLLFMPQTSGKSFRFINRNMSFHQGTANYYGNHDHGHMDDNGVVFTGMKIYPAGGNFDGGEFYLYGVKK